MKMLTAGKILGTTQAETESTEVYKCVDKEMLI